MPWGVAVQAIIGATASFIIPALLTGLWNSIFRNSGIPGAISSHREEFENAPEDSDAKKALFNEYEARTRTYWIKRQPPYRDSRSWLAFWLLYTLIWYACLVALMPYVEKGERIDQAILCGCILLVSAIWLALAIIRIVATYDYLKHCYPDTYEEPKGIRNWLMGPSLAKNKQSDRTEQKAAKTAPGEAATAESSDDADAN